MGVVPAEKQKSTHTKKRKESAPLNATKQQDQPIKSKPLEVNDRQRIKKEHKKRKRDDSSSHKDHDDEDEGKAQGLNKEAQRTEKVLKKSTNDLTSSTRKSHNSNNRKLPFDYRYIVAPMVGASELPFRILCRKYGAQLAYTPMMSAASFGSDPQYRKNEFQTTSFDRPLVCHFAANSPEEFAKAAQMAEPFADAIDLNLGCPQRTAYVGHFGSYLLDPKDRQLIINIVKAGVAAVSIPIFVKIRLLNTYEETHELLRQLYDAGASLIAIHARVRASFERNSAGARDGPAQLDQVEQLKKVFADRILITNGNTITYDDVVNNLQTTQADGIMSAEGILDNPALYLGQLGSREESDKVVQIKGGLEIFRATSSENKDDDDSTNNNKKRKLLKKLVEIERIESKITSQSDDGAAIALNDKQRKKLSKKSKVQRKLAKLEAEDATKMSLLATTRTTTSTITTTTSTTLGALYSIADDKLALALEYIHLVRKYPAVMRTVIFHARRILKTELTTYQLMDQCLACKSVEDLELLIHKMQTYQVTPGSFQYDVQKAKLAKEALLRQKQEEGKRKRYEERMMRKAKREKKTDLEFYLRQGSAVPTLETVTLLKTMSDNQAQMALWKERDHSQHCMAFHVGNNCQRGRTCAFLHLEAQNKNTFVEGDEVAG
jgi:tRNA-dihydrouridine synthase 1